MIFFCFIGEGVHDVGGAYRTAEASASWRHLQGGRFDFEVFRSCVNFVTMVSSIFLNEQAVIGDSELESLLLVRNRGEGVADQGRGWMCVSID
jgi:hypothetical protein